MTSCEWTRGRLRATAASLLVSFAEQVLKWQEPASAMTEMIHRLLRLYRQPPRVVSESTNQHAVSITIEAVACLNSVIVGGQDLFAACEGTNQREQS